MNHEVEELLPKMNNKSAHQEQMLSEIKRYAEAYYTGNSLISDDEFDKLVDRYESIYGKIDKVGWGYESKSDKKFAHKYGHIGSLDKTRSVEGIDFRNKIITDKLDGISCVAYYENGVLVRALTRNNGEVGVDITDKYSLIPGAVISIKDYCKINFTGAVRGEILMRERWWERFSEEFSDQDYKNSRNAVAGIMGADDADKEKLKYFNFIAYKMVGLETEDDSEWMSYREVLYRLREYGFDVVRHVTADELIYPTSIEDMKFIFDEGHSDLPRDGLVITEDLVDIRDNGEVVYDDFAFKFKGDTEDTKVTGISWKLTRTGKMVPTVLVDAVQLAGVTIRRATGHNAQFIKDYNIAEGKTVRITRSGEVIPYIVAVLQEYDDGTEEWIFVSELYNESEESHD